MVHLKKIGGSALLTALFIMTLVAIVATAMSMRLQLDIYRTRLIINHDKLYQASQAVTFWGLSELRDSGKAFSKTLSQDMISVYPGNMHSLVPQISLSGGLYDLQAKFNINLVSEKKRIALFINVLKQVVPQITTEDANNLALALSDWLNPYDPSKGDNYTGYYNSQNPAYYASHQFMQSKSELRLIKDVEAPIYQALAPFITALPDSAAMNLNTASKPVLMSLGNGLSESQLDEVLQARGEEGITEPEKANELLAKLNLPADQITLQSTFFLTVAYANMEEFHLVVYTLMKRSKDKNKKLVVRILRQSFNEF
ncbi:MAG: type II secretion system minor pseudopilin GspK [Legionellales bacterium]